MGLVKIIIIDPGNYTVTPLMKASHEWFLSSLQISYQNITVSYNSLKLNSPTVINDMTTTNKVTLITNVENTNDILKCSYNGIVNSLLK